MSDLIISDPLVRVAADLLRESGGTYLLVAVTDKKPGEVFVVTSGRLHNYQHDPAFRGGLEKAFAEIGVTIELPDPLP
jgi:hypothetical protein